MEISQKSRTISLVIAIIVFVTALWTATAYGAEPQRGQTTNHLVINQIYGGGGKGDTPFTHGFIELYNPTANDIDLTGYKITYSSNRASTNPGSTTTEAGVTETVEKELTGTIKAGTSYLIRCAAETTTVQKYAVNKFDLEWDRVIDNDGTIVIQLLDRDGNAVDGISNRATGFTSIGEGDNPAQKTSKQKSLRRTKAADTDNNLADFALVVWNDASVDQTFIDTNRPRSQADGKWEDGSNNEGGSEPPEYPTQNTSSQNGKLSYVGNYSTGLNNSDGGVAEIVKYNKDNKKMYLVNGAEQTVDMVSLKEVASGKTAELKTDARLDMKVIAEANKFECGDITSVDVNTKRDIIAMAVQGADYKSKGSIVITDYDGNYKGRFECGYQPDMVQFTPDGNYVMTADEGEPREGYTAVDPQGSVTLVNISGGLDAQPKIINFESFDTQRDALVSDGVILNKNTQPSTDLEPEYIAVSQDSKKAYVALQEANAMATLDIGSAAFTSIKGLGTKDFSKAGNELDVLEDGKAELSTQNLEGVYMPDGCATITIGSKNYVLTANEGDSREWGTKPDKYTDETDAVVTSGGKDYEVTSINTTLKDGLDSNKTYLYGARSFSIWDADTMTQVYDSGSDFESITAKLYPTCFNSSNNKSKLDARSSKKGPEPENVTTLKVGSKTYAFTGLERIGGLMMYDVTNPAEASYTDYINLRNFQGTNTANSGSLAPEGLSAIEAADSPTGYPMVLVANEVSGNIDVLEIREGNIKATQKITASSVTKTYGDKAFSINVKNSGNGKLTYISSNTKVATVSSTGKVTIKSPGRVTIKITAAATTTFNSATKSITVTAKPKTVSISSVKSSKKKTLKATWKISSKASGYQVRIAKNSKFTKGVKSATVTGNGKTFKNLKKRTKYYVKVRAYKKTGSIKIYGSYSKVKSVRVR